jgi:hypothetical protein
MVLPLRRPIYAGGAGNMYGKRKARPAVMPPPSRMVIATMKCGGIVKPSQRVHAPIDPKAHATRYQKPRTIRQWGR